MRRAGESHQNPPGQLHSACSLLTPLGLLPTFTCTDSYCAQPTPYHEPCAAPPSSAPTPVACIALAITDDRHRSALLDPQAFPRRAVCFLVRPSQDGWVRSGRLAGLGSGAGTCCTDPIACSDVRQTKIAVDLSSLGVRRRRALNQRALAERRPGCPKANRVPTARTSPPILRSSACTCSTCTRRLSRSRIGGIATPCHRRRCSCDQHLA
jgi:hypothetical protein